MKKSFRQLPLCPRDFSLIGFRWRKMLYFDKVMPMRSAAYVCQRVTNAIIYVHRQLGFWSINYLDDFGSAELRDTAMSSFNAMSSIMRNIGAQEAEEKAVFPCTRMEFLGNTIDSQKMTLEVSDDRKTELMSLIDKWLVKDRFTIKQLQSLIGKLSFVTNCVRAGRVFLSRLLQTLQENSDHAIVGMDTEILKDLRWWYNYLPRFNGISLLWLQDSEYVDQWLASDSSLIGAGAIHGKEYFHYKFPEFVLTITQNIVQRELLAVVIAIKLWAKDLHGRMIRFSTDNQNALFAINKGRTRDPFMLCCIRELAWVCAEHQIMIKACYVNTKLNKIPDALSRWYQQADARRQFKRMTDKTWVRWTIKDNMVKFVSPWQL